MFTRKRATSALVVLAFAAVILIGAVSMMGPAVGNIFSNVVSNFPGQGYSLASLQNGSVSDAVRLVNNSQQGNQPPANQPPLEPQPLVRTTDDGWELLLALTDEAYDWLRGVVDAREPARTGDSAAIVELAATIIERVARNSQRETRSR